MALQIVTLPNWKKKFILKTTQKNTTRGRMEVFRSWRNGGTNLYINNIHMNVTLFLKLVICTLKRAKTDCILIVSNGGRCW